MGNICRSPLAEGVFGHLARQRGVADSFTIDSCGTGGWHVGETPDARAIDVARRHGIRLVHVARQFDPGSDFDAFDLILAMDRDNLTHVRGLATDGQDRKSRLLREFEPGAPASGRALDVPDPYYGGPEGFDRVFRMLHDSCAGLLDAILRQQ
jgi:protein-tyrosine phosphatase